MKKLFNLLRYVTVSMVCITWIICIGVLLLILFPSPPILTFDFDTTLIIIFSLYLSGWMLFGIGEIINEFYKNINHGSKL